MKNKIEKILIFIVLSLLWIISFVVINQKDKNETDNNNSLSEIEKEIIKVSENKNNNNTIEDNTETLDSILQEIDEDDDLKELINDLDFNW